MSTPSPSPDIRRVRFRKLRIAWSVGWGLAAVLLIGLWVRSYWWGEVLYVPITNTRTITLGSILGGTSLSFFVPTAPGAFEYSPRFQSEKFGERGGGFWDNFERTRPRPARFGIVNHQSYATILLPYFVLVGVAGLLAALPWLRYRFRLRTLLIATTLVAVVLGLAVYAAK